MRDLAWSPARPGASGTYLVPARTLVDAARTMSPGEPVTIRLRADRDRDAELAREYGPGSAGHPGLQRSASSTADAMIGFESAGRRLTTRLIAGEYIKYRSRFPADFACRADLPAAPFIEAVRRVSLVAERGSAVRLTFSGGEVTIEAETQGRARAREMVRADFHGAEPAIAFSPHFLLDGIAAAGVSATTPEPGAEAAGESGDSTPAEAFIRLEFNSSTKPAVVTGIRATSNDATGQAPPNFRYLVVPLRTAGRQ
jgi:DNA polymerase-3 subunit beta